MRLRLTLAFIFIVLIATSSVVSIAARRTEREIRNFVARGGIFGTEEIVKNLEIYFAVNGSWNGVQRLFRASQNFGMGQGMGPNRRIRFADADGNILFDSRNPQGGGKIPEEVLSFSIPIEFQDQPVGYLIPNNGIPIGPAIENSLLSRLNNAAITAAVFAGGISVVLALILAYTLLRPVRELTHAAAALGKGDLNQRVSVQGEDEIATLAKTFNHMAESLQQAEAQRKAMTADIAHELRNPLAVQRANLEALMDGVYPLTSENLDPIMEQTLLLERLVDDLRTIALADSGRLELVQVPTDYPALIQRVVSQFKPKAEANRVTIDFHLPKDQDCPALLLDPGRVEQILVNLISNAFRYTPENGTIEIHLNCNPENIQLLIRDQGPGIPEDILPHIFERFYRGDRGRSRVDGGTGLGLSIARKLAEAQYGSLEAHNHPEGGALFKLSFPVDIELAGSPAT